jgi:hypothetical protein
MGHHGAMANRRNPFVVFVGGLVALWLLISLLGVLVRGLFYLTVLGVVLLVLTAMYGAYKAGRR